MYPYKYDTHIAKIMSKAEFNILLRSSQGM